MASRLAAPPLALLLLCSAAPVRAQSVPRLDLDPSFARLIARDMTLASGDSSPAVTSADAPPAAPSIVARGQVDLEAPLLLNGRLLGNIDVLVDAQGRGDIDAARLAHLLEGAIDPAIFAALQARIAGRQRVPLAELAVPPLTIGYDPGSLEVRADLPTERLRAERMSFHGAEAPDPDSFARPAGIAGGVAIGLDQGWAENGPDRGREPLRITTDAFLTLGGFPGVTLRGGGIFSERPGHGFSFERQQVRLTYDAFGDAIHFVAGEFTPAVAGFQGAAPILGIGVGRDYAGIRPFENIRPSGRGSLVLERASTVIVEVNGVELRRLQLAPGRYELTDISATSGANDVRLFVQDDLGRREVAAASFFSATSMLAENLTDFGFAVGKRQSAPGDYGGPMTASAYVRRGINGRLTLGAGLQYASGDWQTLGEAVVGTPVGLFRLQGSASRVQGHTGEAASLDWLQTLDVADGTLNLTVLSSVYSRDFASPFDLVRRVNDQRWRIDARADWRRGPLGISLTAGYADSRSANDRGIVEAAAYYGIGRLQFSGTFGVERSGSGGWSPRALLGVSLRLGNRATASLRTDTRRKSVVAEYSRFPVDEVGDLSGRIQLARDDDRYGLVGEARYFGNRFIANVQQDLFYAARPDVPAVRRTRVQLGTFIGFADGSLSIGRPPQYGFAIFPRHKSLAGSAVTIRDEAGYLVGRQDALGSALVPFNRAFSPVTEAIEVEPLPPGYDLGEGQLRALPGFASGYRMPVGSEASRVALGYLLGDSGPIAEVGGSVEMIGGKAFEPRPFFTNAAGRFAVDGLLPGDYRMIVDGREVARFSITADMEGLVDVGRIRTRP